MHTGRLLEWFGWSRRSSLVVNVDFVMHAVRLVAQGM